MHFDPPNKCHYKNFSIKIDILKSLVFIKDSEFNNTD